MTLASGINFLNYCTSAERKFQYPPENNRREPSPSYPRATGRGCMRRLCELVHWELLLVGQVWEHSMYGVIKAAQETQLSTFVD